MNWIERKALRHYMIPHLKKFWATYGTLLGGAFYYLMPGLQAIAAAHPKTAIGVLLGAVIAAFHAEAPKSKK
jgi:hypothetical protein